MTTSETPDSVQDRFHRNDRVRLLERHGNHPAGALGHIIGRFARVDPTWVVSFSGVLTCLELRGDEIALAAA